MGVGCWFDAVGWDGWKGVGWGGLVRRGGGCVG